MTVVQTKPGPINLEVGWVENKHTIGDLRRCTVSTSTEGQKVTTINVPYVAITR
jgi:hypothetical protein